MTLCLTWNINNQVWFASDSRLTNPDKSIVTNTATKIFKITIEAIDPTEKIVFKASYGFCFAGSYLNGSTIADTISEILSNLQIVPDHSDFTIENISEIAFTIYKKTSTQLMQINRDRGIAVVMFGGHCPETKEFKLYRFEPKKYEVGDDMIEFKKEQILLNDETIFLGDENAIQKAKSLLPKINKTYSHLHLLKDIINDKSLVTVGGQIQIGHFRKENFKTYGIAETEQERDDHGFYHVKDKMTYRGLDLGFIENDFKIGDIHILRIFLNPFEDERNELFEKNNKLNEEIINKNSANK